MTTFNVYCDESGHLEHDQQQIMVLGAVWCPEEKVRESAVRLREIKVRHCLSPSFEVKWTKVGSAKQRLYLDLLDYFFDDDDLHFRGVVIDKSCLDHQAHGSDHDTWYYKMYFQLIEPLLDPRSKYRIYLDIKDSRSQQKVRKLHDVLCNSQYDFRREVIERVQQVRSHEVEQVQLADLLIGAVAYLNRGMGANVGKQALVERMQHRSRLSLQRSTLLREPKVNLFFSVTPEEHFVVTDEAGWLPPLLMLQDHGGDWATYLEAVYAVFRRDFMDSPMPPFRGRRLALKRHPLIDGREATFWHLISEGKIENERIPDLRRCERIPWPRPIIEGEPSGRIRCWSNERKGELRHLLALPDFSYLVVLADRVEYLLPWTAYCVEHAHQRRKLQKEWEEWRARNAKTAP